MVGTEEFNIKDWNSFSPFHNSRVVDCNAFVKSKEKSMLIIKCTLYTSLRHMKSNIESKKVTIAESKLFIDNIILIF